MLILTLKKGGGIFIGKEISIHLVEVQGHKIRLGIAAPKEIPVHREEIHNLIQREIEREEIRNQIRKEIESNKRSNSTPIPHENRNTE